MKKFFLMLMALMLAMTTLTAFAEDEAVIPSPEAESVTIEGFVMNVADEMLLLLTRDGLYVEAHLTPDTIFDGKDVAIGDFIQIDYSGMMTRSIPAQVNADSVTIIGAAE